MAWCGALLTGCAEATHRDGAGLAQWKTGSWFLLLCGITYGLMSVAWDHPQPGLIGIIAPDSVARAEWLTAVALSAWTAGYCVSLRWSAAAKTSRIMRRMAARREPTVRGPLAPWLMYGAGTAARISSAVLLGHFGYIGNPATAASTASWYEQILADVALACPLALAIAALRLYREKAPGARTTLIILLATEFASAGVSGFKGGFLTAIVAILIPRMCAGYRIPVSVLVGATAFLLLIGIPFTAAYRAQIRDGSASLGPGHALQVAASLARSSLTGITTSALPSSVGYLVQRTQEINTPAVVIQDTPSRFPYASPAGLPEQIAAQMIPRVLWPGKPIINEGYQFSQEYYGTPSGEYTSAAVTTEADLYRHGGWIPSSLEWRSSAT